MGRGLNTAGQELAGNGCGLNTDMNNHQKHDITRKFQKIFNDFSLII